MRIASEPSSNRYSVRPRRLRRFSQASIGTFVAADDPRDNHETLRIVDLIDHTPGSAVDAQPKSPEVPLTRQLRGTVGSGLSRQCQDYSPQPGKIWAAKSVQLTLCGRRQYHAIDHPYSALGR
jgi:hypothetical protein